MEWTIILKSFDATNWYFYECWLVLHTHPKYLSPTPSTNKGSEIEDDYLEEQDGPPPEGNKDVNLANNGVENVPHVAALPPVVPCDLNLPLPRVQGRASNNLRKEVKTETTTASSSESDVVASRKETSSLSLTKATATGSCRKF
jgi:hypothetical protein